MKLKFCMAAIALASTMTMFAQSDDETTVSINHFGIRDGFRYSMMNISDIDKTLFPDKTGVSGNVFSIYYQHSFGKNQHFVLRPEIAFLTRGGGYKNIYSEDWETKFENIKDIKYNVRGKYLDFRLPILYQFKTPEKKFRPYVYVAPVLGFCTGGYIQAEMQTNLEDSSKGYGYEGIRLDATKANMSPFYFAGMVGVGFNLNFSIDENPFYLGLDLAYEHGFTNTFGNDMDAENQYYFGYLKRDPANKGSRKYSGIEINLSIGIPFCIFTKKEPTTVVEKVVVSEPIREIVYVEKDCEPAVPEKDCYTLDEINELMLAGKPVEGKTICAINDAINFEFGKSDIKPSSYPYLDRLAETLVRTTAKIKVKGHTDNVGNDEFNMNLSRDRAMKVMDYLLKKGVPRARLSYDYFGSTRPLTTNDTEEGRRTNRRVEFEIMD